MINEGRVDGVGHFGDDEMGDGHFPRAVDPQDIPTSGSEFEGFVGLNEERDEISVFRKLGGERFGAVMETFCRRNSRNILCRCCCLFMVYFMLFMFVILFLAGYFQARIFDKVFSFMIVCAIGVVFFFIFTIIPNFLFKTTEKKYKYYDRLKKRVGKESKKIKKRYEKLRVPFPRMSYTALIVYLLVTIFILGKMLNSVFVGKITSTESGDSYMVFILILTWLVVNYAAMYVIEFLIRFLYWFWVKLLAGVKIRIIVATIIFSITIWCIYTITVFRFNVSFAIGLGFAIFPGFSMCLVPVMCEECFRVVFLVGQVSRGIGYINEFLQNFRIQFRRDDEDEDDSESDLGSEGEVEDEEEEEEDEESSDPIQISEDTDSAEEERRRRIKKRKMDKARRRYKAKMREKERKVRKRLKMDGYDDDEEERRRGKGRKGRRRRRDIGSKRRRSKRRRRRNMDDELDSADEVDDETRRELDGMLDEGKLDSVFSLHGEEEQMGERQLVKDDDGDLSEFHKRPKNLMDSDDDDDEEEGGDGIEIDEQGPPVYDYGGHQQQQVRRIKRYNDDGEEIEELLFSSDYEGEEEEELEDEDLVLMNRKLIELILRCCYLCAYCMSFSILSIGMIILFSITFSQNYETRNEDGLLGMKEFLENYPEMVSQAQNPSTLQHCIDCDIERLIYGSRIGGRRKLYEYIEDDVNNAPNEKTVKWKNYFLDEETGRQKVVTESLSFEYKRKWISPATNELEHIIKFGIIRKSLMGFDETSIPLNAMVWHPRSRSDSSMRYPLVLILHGSEGSMLEDVDEKFIWLGEFLAKQGYIAVVIDVTFLNTQLNFFPFYDELDAGYGQNYDARALMVLHHLRFIKENLCNDNPVENLDESFLFKADWNRVALIGHSRGGQGIMIVDALKNAKYWPRDGNILLDSLQFDIHAYITLSPSFKPYDIHGSKLSGENAHTNHLMIWGGRDTDILEPEGLEYFSSIKFKEHHDLHPDQKIKYRKCFVYIDGANHGHYASKNVDTFGFGKYLTSQNVLSYYEQMETTRVYIGAFLNDVFQNQSIYTDFLRDPRVGQRWLPKKTIREYESNEDKDVYPSYLITQYEDDRFKVLADFSKDFLLETTTLEGGVITATNFKEWSEGKLVSGTIQLEQDVVFLRCKMGEVLEYKLDFSDIKGVSAKGFRYLSFMMSDNVQDRMTGLRDGEEKKRPTIRVKVLKQGETKGDTIKPVRLEERLPPREFIEKIKMNKDWPPLILQTYFVDFRDFYPADNLDRIGKIVFEITGREQEHTIVLSRIGLAKKN